MSTAERVLAILFEGGDPSPPLTVAAIAGRTGYSLSAVRNFLQEEVKAERLFRVGAATDHGRARSFSRSRPDAARGVTLRERVSRDLVPVGLRPVTALTWAYLAIRSGGEWVYVSLDAVAGATGYTVDEVSRRIAALTRTGAIERRRASGQVWTRADPSALSPVLLSACRRAVQAQPADLAPRSPLRREVPRGLLSPAQLEERRAKARERKRRYLQEWKARRRAERAPEAGSAPAGGSDGLKKASGL